MADKAASFSSDGWPSFDDFAEREREVVAEDKGCSFEDGEVEKNSAEADVSVPVNEADKTDP